MKRRLDEAAVEAASLVSGIAAGWSRRESANKKSCWNQEFGIDQDDGSDGDTPEAALLLLAAAGCVPLLLVHAYRSYLYFVGLFVYLV
jgi:hypothetical protein